MISKKSIVLFIFFVLLVKKQWKIILILVFAYYFLQFEQSEPYTTIDKHIEQVNRAIDEEELYYLEKYQKLESLKDEYPLRKIRMEQVKVINQMLYNVPLSREQEAKWNQIKLTLMEI